MYDTHWANWKALGRVALHRGGNWREREDERTRKSASTNLTAGRLGALGSVALRRAGALEGRWHR